MIATKEYDAKIDVKKRVTIRGAHFDHYHVIEYPDGKIVLEPRELVTPFELSKKTLAMMDSSVAKYKVGAVSTPIDLSAFKDSE